MSTRLAAVIVSAGVAALGVAGCRCERAASGGGARELEVAAPRVYWLRRARLMDGSGAQVVHEVEAPTRVEVLPGGRVRSAAGVEPAFEGRLSEELLRRPSPQEGLGLYVQRVAELRWPTADGHSIGRVYPGAFVGVTAEEGADVQVALPAFSAPAERAGRAEAPVLAFVPAAALGPRPLPLGAAPAEGRLIEDYAAGISLGAEPSGESEFAVTLCGDLRVLEEQQQARRVAQYHAGVELVGWTRGATHFGRGPGRCKLRLVWRRETKLMVSGGTSLADVRETAAVPAGFVQADGGGGARLLRAMEERQPLYWAEREGNAVVCRRWQFEMTAPESNGVRRGFLVGDAVRLPSGPALPWFSVTYRGSGQGAVGELEATGPQYSAVPRRSRDYDADRGGEHCTYSFAVVASSGDALRVLPTSWDPDYVAWHPDDEEWWFFTREACEAKAGRAGDAPNDGGARVVPGLHVRCYDGLRETGADGGS